MKREAAPCAGVANIYLRLALALLDHFVHRVDFACGEVVGNTSVLSMLPGHCEAGVARLRNHRADGPLHGAQQVAPHHNRLDDDVLTLGRWRRRVGCTWQRRRRRGGGSSHAEDGSCRCGDGSRARVRKKCRERLQRRSMHSRIGRPERAKTSVRLQKRLCGELHVW